jgi:hypothetical protein
MKIAEFYNRLDETWTWKHAVVVTVLSAAVFASFWLLMWQIGRGGSVSSGNTSTQSAPGQTYTLQDVDAAKDEATRARILRPMAERGDARAQAWLGLQYDRGDGVRQDYVEAVKWFRLAADKGDPEGEFLLCPSYRDGKSVPEDVVLAYAWCDIAAQNKADDPDIPDIGKLAAEVLNYLVEVRMTPAQITEAEGARTGVEAEAIKL